MSILLNGSIADTTAGEMNARRPIPTQAFHEPSDEDSAKGKALINFLMQDRIFLGLLRSNDAKVRAGAIDKLNEAHYQAYGGSPRENG